MTDTTVLLSGLRFGEGPRHGPDGLLYVSDFYDHEVFRIDLASGDRVGVCEVPQQPSGLGWLPDSRLLVVSMVDRRVLRLEPDGTLAEHADLTKVADFHTNDMLVDSAGRAYVGNFGFDLHSFIAEHGTESLLNRSFDAPGAVLAMVTPDGAVSIVAEDLKFPNGMALLGDTLVVAETLAFRLTAFDVAKDGSLSNPRCWADLSTHGIVPDGICADGAGAIWTSSAMTPCAYRVIEGGEITNEVHTSQNCYAVSLTGPDRGTLVCVTAPSSEPWQVADKRLGKLEVVKVGFHG